MSLRRMVVRGCVARVLVATCVAVLGGFGFGGELRAQEHGIALSLDLGAGKALSGAVTAGYFNGGADTKWSRSIALGLWGLGCGPTADFHDPCPAEGGAQMLLLGASRRSGLLFTSLQGGLARWEDSDLRHPVSPIADASVGIGVFGKHHPRILAAIGGRSAFSADYWALYAKLSLSFTLRPYVPPER